MSGCVSGIVDLRALTGCALAKGLNRIRLFATISCESPWVGLCFAGVVDGVPLLVVLPLKFSFNSIQYDIRGAVTADAA